ncbi:MULTISPECIES: universal stress protein [Kitasatospora]|uniref:Universal stress protein n=1 Tax=Kitasatospora cathayae TaxID=3004092 RepID=A0ABY7PZ22_9ACTN|nr:universal stress protein [Kitasatospora sp. HUAS 3-15]WBP85616.1 universal stress protein [Kitasatospora sp. HUAS 3-15]
MADTGAYPGAGADKGAGEGRIVVGVSGSLGSLAALHHAVAEARRTDAEVLAVLCWTPPGEESGGRRTVSPPVVDVCRDAAVTRLRQALDQAFAGRHTGVRLRGQAVRGETGHTLLRCADRPGDVLVLGAGRERGRLSRLIRPSITAHCVRHATCPVLTVPRPPLQRDLEALRRGYGLRALVAGN